MFSTYFTLFVVAMVSSTKAAGVGKAWEVSPVQKSDHSAPLSPWPRTDTSPFEVRSISGIGRVAPSESHHEPFDSGIKMAEEKMEDKDWEVSAVQKSDHSAPLSPWPRTDTSPFEVRSISGIGRVAPSESHHEPFDSGIKMAEEKMEDKDWEVSAVEKTDHSAALEVRSISQQEGHHEEFDTDLKSDEEKFEGPSKNAESVSEASPEVRQSRELEDLDNSNIFVSEDYYNDRPIEGFMRKPKQMEDVEALPSLWEKFRAQNRAGKNYGHCSEVEEIDEQPRSREETVTDNAKEKPRVRRETEVEMEKIGGSKNVREARLSSPESWSKQPISVEFRHRTNLDEITDKDEKSVRSSVRGFQAPHADFVTANRRSFTESRESRDLPISSQRSVSRSFDEIMPGYRNTLRDRDYDSSYSRGLFYPERYRTERDYFVRGFNEPNYPQDRYREADFDLYGRSRPPMPKPKRIIYYATLPEVVRKPVDLRSYPRAPYDPMTRSSSNVMPHNSYYKRRDGGATDHGRYRYYSYPYGSNYDNYDMYPKKSSWNDRPYVPYPERIEDARRRQHDTDHANMRDASRNEEAMLELGHDRKMPDRVKTRDQEKSPWPVKVGTEVSVKQDERVTGRKIFGQHDDYNRFRNNARMDRDREGTGSVEGRD